MPEPMTITEAGGFIRTGELTPTELLEQCLARVDRYEDRVRAWVYLDREGAREQAERLTAELKANNYRGPLHGIPIGIKDIIDVFDMPTGCGSKLWANSYARRDARVVERLRQAGAIIMGKTVTTAFASFDPPVTRNPWNLERTPGGSSSGSAAAVACGMCLGALATQTGGSITRPAAYCGVCSIKPTYGRVSVDGVLPLAPSMDHVGAMANCVRDLAILLEVLNATDPESNFYPEDFTSGLGEVGEWLDLGITRMYGMFDEGMEPPMRIVLDSACTLLRKRTSPIKRFVLPYGFSEVIPRHQLVMAVEAAQFHEPRLRRHPDDYPPRIRGLIEEGLNYPAVEYARTKEHQRRLSYSLDHCFVHENRVAITPATLGPAPDAATTGPPTFNSPWSYTGLPTVSLPIGWTDDGLPLAMQLVSPQRRERELLSVAAWAEEIISFARRPVPL